MITVILEDSHLKELERISESSNAEYLIQGDNSKYKYLSQLSEIDYDVFSSEDMPGLIRDLLRLSKSLTQPEQLEHVANIVRFAKRCQSTNGVALIFTPWGNE